MRRRTLLALVGSAGATAALAACAPSAPEEQGDGQAGAGAAGASQDTLRIATTTDVVNYNPLVGNSRSDYWVTNLMYPHLLTIAADGSKAAEVATDWGYSTPTTGYYEIRDDMVWSDGTPLTAEDVAWTINAVKRDQPAGTFTGQVTSVTSAQAVSATRVELTLSQPNTSVVEEIGFWGNVVPKHVFEPAGSVATFANDGSSGGWVSAGPYVLTEVQAGSSYTLQRVEGSYPLVQGGVPVPATVVYRVFPDVNTEILALRSGEVDVIANALPPAQVQELSDTPGITVQEVPGLGYAHLQYNLDHPDLARVEVRQALAQSVDYAAIRRVVLRDQAVSTGSSPIMPVLEQYWDPAWEDQEYRYDPDAARALLTGAGYTADASGAFPLTFKMIYSLQDPVTSQWANLVRDGAAAAGITIELAGLERNTYLAATSADDYDIYAGNFAIMDDPATNFSLAYLPGGVINYSHVDDPELNALIAQASAEADPDTKVALMRQAAELVREQVYDNVMYTQNLYVAHSDQWSGFTVKPSELLSIVSPTSVAAAGKQV